MTEPSLGLAHFIGRLFAPAWWLVALALVLATVLWWRGGRRALGLAMGFASVAVLAHAAFSLGWLHLAQRLFDESVDLLPIGSRLSSLHDLSSAALMAHVTTATPLAWTATAGVLTSAGAHLYARHAGRSRRQRELPMLGRWSWIAVAAAAIGAGVLFQIGTRIPGGQFLTPDERLWTDFEDRIGKKGALGIDAVPLRGPEFLRMASVCMELARELAPQDELGLFDTNRDRRTSPGGRRSALADACARAARRLENGFSVNSRETFSAIACTAQYRSVLTNEERGLFSSEVCHEPEPAAPPGVGGADGVAGEGVERTVASLRPKMKRCYDKGLSDEPTMAGRAVIVVKTTPSGDVSGTELESNEGLSAEVLVCLQNVIKGVRLDARGSTVRIPVKFVQQR